MATISPIKMGCALDFLLKATVEARQAAGQYRGARSQDSPFALREALGMGAAFHPGEALGDDTAVEPGMSEMMVRHGPIRSYGISPF